MNPKILLWISIFFLANAETTESPEDTTIIIQPDGICDPHCVRECESFFSENPEVCQSNCGCDEDLPHEQEFNKQPLTLNEDSIRWSFHTNPQNSNLNCRSKCERFCDSIKGNNQVCKIKCSEQFCESFLESWLYLGFVLGVLTLALVVILKLRNSHQVNRKLFSYQRL